MLRVIQRFLAQSIACQQQHFLAEVVKCNREHAAQLLNAVGAQFFVKVNDYFRICVGIELVSSRLQIMAQFGKIINFPVEHNPYVFIFIVYRLTAGRKVNNAQPAHTQSDAPLRVDPFIIRTTVDNGPDDEGIHAQGRVGLGMRRLSIIDLSTGRQPIHNEDKNIWVVFNGEIYNFPELRHDLEARGHQFYTHTDTEVIVHLYEELGADCVKKLRGMFAIALYDFRQEVLLLARDRLGKKPLYYAQHQGRLLFGSEIKTLLAVAPQLAEVDLEGLLQYFYFGYIPDPFTAFRRIHKLPPGSVMEYASGEVKIRQYWDLPRYGTNSPASEEECLEELERRLAEAVRIRLISDVPLGALISGGGGSVTVLGLVV